MSEGARVWKVCELVRQARDVLQADETLRSITVEGEVSNFNPHSSGHWYFTLKDSSAVITAVMFKGSNRRSSLQVKDGMLVRVHGSISVYESRGQMQLVVDDIRRAGLGELMERINELKEKLRREGLFDRPKKPIPGHPAAIAVATSPDGAALRDVVKVVRKRAPSVDILLAPCQVQGEGAPTSIVRALTLADASRADVVILGRGGGSFEDLLPFQSEEVVRKVASMAKPVVSAVGHQTDHVMTDDAADARAATPSEAAEMVVRDAATVLQELDGLRDAMDGQVSEILVVLEGELSACRTRLTPARYIDRAEAELELVGEKRAGLARSAAAAVSAWEAALHESVSSLCVMNPRNTLARGYSLAESQSGTPLTSIIQLNAGDAYALRFKDGLVVSRVESKEDAR